jgi:hypothetical protein
MEYLAYQMIWYVLVAFAFGLLVGWFACGRTGERP